MRARGAIARLADTAGEIELRALDATLAGVPIVLDTRAVVSFEPNALSSTPLLVRVGRETQVRLQGTLSANGAPTGIDVQVESAIADLLSLAAPALPELPIEAGTSRVKLDLHVGGTLAAPQPSGTLALEAASVRYADIPPFSDVTVDARIEPARIALNTVTARWQGASLSAEGAIPFRMIVPPPRPGATGLASWGSNWLTSLPDEPRSATLSARVTGVTTDALASFVDPAQLERVALTADATLTADADRFALDALRASIVLDQASLSLAGVPFTQSTPTRVRLEGGRARLEELRWNAQGNELRASGSADLIGPAPALDLAVDGALDLRVLGAFASGIASGGIAAHRVHRHGTARIAADRRQHRRVIRRAAPRNAEPFGIRLDRLDRRGRYAQGDDVPERRYQRRSRVHRRQPGARRDLLPREAASPSRRGT